MFLVADEVLPRIAFLSNQLFLHIAEGLPTFSADGHSVRPGLDEYLALMQKCWSPRPAQRPKFKEIVEQLQSVLSSQ